MGSVKAREGIEGKREEICEANSFGNTRAQELIENLICISICAHYTYILGVYKYVFRIYIYIYIYPYMYTYIYIYEQQCIYEYIHVYRNVHIY